MNLLFTGTAEDTMRWGIWAETCYKIGMIGRERVQPVDKPTFICLTNLSESEVALIQFSGFVLSKLVSDTSKLKALLGGLVTSIHTCLKQCEELNSSINRKMRIETLEGFKILIDNAIKYGEHQNESTEDENS